MPNALDRESTLSRVLVAAAQLVSGLPTGDAVPFLGFARAAVTQVNAGLFATMLPSEAAAALLDAWRFVQSASADGVNVRVTPTDDGLVVVSNMADQPFIVDTLRKGLRLAGATSMGGFNTVVRIDREDGTRVVAEGEGRAESIIRFVAMGIPAERATEVEGDLRARLEIAGAAVADFEAIIARVEGTVDAAIDVSGEDGIETADFLRWLLSDNFVFIGLSWFGSDGTIVGLGADRRSVPGQWAGLWPTVAAKEFDGIVRIRKGEAESPVHRNGRVDVLRIRLPSGQLVVRGMFTHRALTQACRHLPILRRRLATVLAETRQRPNSYRYRGLANIFDAMPTEWLFSASLDQIREVIEICFDAEQEQRARVHVTQQDGGATTFTLVSLPERRYSDVARARVVNFLRELTGAVYTHSDLFAGRFDSVLLQVYQTGTRLLSAEDLARLDQLVTELGATFIERATAAVRHRFGDDAPTLLGRYADAFPSDYQDKTSGELTATDIDFLERSRATGNTLAHVVEFGGDLFLRVYETADILLSGLLPIIDHFGVLISDQASIEVRARGEGAQYIDVFRIENVPGVDRATLLARAEKLVGGLEAVFQKHMTSDPFNRLLLRAGLAWQEVDLVRAWIGYARQIGLKQSIPRAQEILLNQSECVAAIIALFHAKFDPDLAGDRAVAITAATTRVEDTLGRIRTNDEDVVMRTIANLVDSTLRTNFYRHDRVCHYISFKLDHARIKQLPAPRMMFEIYVHHREVEGLHLRGGPIARGGLRFSDRADFRTEILGLVTTQMVKNVVIVPEGSKGGFYIKYTIDDPRERRRKGDELYQILIRGLLDVTDNIVAGDVVHPPRVVVHDGNDPYLVVAADKGTAHLSDTANKLSLAYGFWLGDAFASGGSNGYDHKVVGITARGAWVLVKRHFREMGMDADRDLFTCVGVGDCGGDVFGNGVIETRKMRLQAAFNHVHIFLDPNPDPEVSFDERRRLFDGVLGWEHYNTSLISAGGGVYERKAKSIPLSAEVKAMLGTLEDELAPDEVIRLILKMPVDLIWNGGIGTYVKASWETNPDANDPPNDGLRISAPELRAKIVGEGGNLGFTQAARIEYALAGGRLNTDFVDNSGGVDTSDHEVNLKILLNPMVAAGRITTEQRNTFIRSMTDEVARMVLADNHANGRLISLDVVRSAKDPNPFARTVDWATAKGNVTRAFLTLPTDDELRRRAANRVGLVRPEIATLQAHVKMHLFKMLMQEDENNIPTFAALVTNYFPHAVRETYPDDIPTHMLRKAIGMTVTLTEVMTDAGSAFFPMMMDVTGASATRIAGAWLEAMRLIDGNSLRHDLVDAKARPDGAYGAWTLLTEGVEQLVASWLAPGSAGWGVEDADELARASDALTANWSHADRTWAAQAAKSYVGREVPQALADRIVRASQVVTASEVCAVARARSESIERSALRYLAVGHATRLVGPVRGQGTRRSEGRWDPVARGILRLRYQALLRELVLTTDITEAQLGLGTDRCAESLAAGSLKKVVRVVDQILGESADVSSLLVAEQQIRAAL